MLNREKIVERAQTGQRENRNLDFKSSFDPSSNAEWCEIIKDIVAFANTGGGAIVIGLNDNATASGFDVMRVLAIDSADITNRVERYTGFQFSDFELIAIERDGARLAAFVIFGVDTPMVFQRPGTYAIDARRQKTAFSKGTVYFRHGSKSEPATMDDLRDWRDRELEKVRQDWLGGIRKVVEAPEGHTIQIVSADAIGDGVVEARIGADENAIAVRPQNAEYIWPHRQVDLVRLVNEATPEEVTINSHDVQCLKLRHSINPTDHPEFVFRSHHRAAPQYSDVLVRWIVDQYNANNDFFQEARRLFRENRG